jgi:hypothetical protein
MRFARFAQASFSFPAHPCQRRPMNTAIYCRVLGGNFQSERIRPIRTVRDVKIPPSDRRVRMSVPGISVLAWKISQLAVRPGRTTSFLPQSQQPDHGAASCGNSA